MEVPRLPLREIPSGESRYEADIAPGDLDLLGADADLRGRRRLRIPGHLCGWVAGDGLRPATDTGSAHCVVGAPGVGGAAACGGRAVVVDQAQFGARHRQADLTQKPGQSRKYYICRQQK
mgnify:CR=1 FL=1